MDAKLQNRLTQLSHDLRAGRVDRAALFWLKIFADMATEGGGEVRSDHWVEAGLAAAQQVPGLAATALAPRQRLVSEYGLFRFVRLNDEAVFSGQDLADLGWERKYRVDLLPALADHLAELQEWTEVLWKELGGVSPEFAALEKVLAQYGTQGRSALLEVLHEAQSIFGGWLPRAAVERVASALNVPTADVYGVTEFYEMFYTRPVGHTVVRICQDAPCALAGVDALMDGVCQHLGIKPGETTPDGQYTLEPVRCLGLCDRAPAALVNLDRYGPLDPAKPETLLNGSRLGEPRPSQRLVIGGLVKLALSNVGVVDPARLKEYIAQGGTAALCKAFTTMTPNQVLEEVKASKLVGRGGAAFPTGLKWEFAASNAGPRFVICNADESELPDDEYPFILSTGRVLYHWHGGTMTRVSALDEIWPECTVEMSPNDAARLGLETGDWVDVASRRGTITTRLLVTERSPDGTIFIPFHFSEAAANVLTDHRLDKRAKIPDYKVCSVQVTKATSVPEVAEAGTPLTERGAIKDPLIR